MQFKVHSWSSTTHTFGILIMTHFTSLFPHREIVANIQKLTKREREAQIFLPDCMNLFNKASKKIEQQHISSDQYMFCAMF